MVLVRPLFQFEKGCWRLHAQCWDVLKWTVGGERSCAGTEDAVKAWLSRWGMPEWNVSTKRGKRDCRYFKCRVSFFGARVQVGQKQTVFWSNEVPDSGLRQEGLPAGAVLLPLLKEVEHMSLLRTDYAQKTSKFVLESWSRWEAELQSFETSKRLREEENKVGSCIVPPVTLQMRAAELSSMPNPWASCMGRGSPGVGPGGLYAGLGAAASPGVGLGGFCAGLGAAASLRHVGPRGALCRTARLHQPWCVRLGGSMQDCGLHQPWHCYAHSNRAGESIHVFAKGKYFLLRRKVLHGSCWLQV